MIRAGILIAAALLTGAWTHGNGAVSPTLVFATLANGAVSSTAAGSGTYTVAAPSGLTSATWGGGCSGASTVTGFSAGAGAWSATFSTPSGAGSGCTVTATGTGSNTNTATSPGATISGGGGTTFSALHTYYMSPSGSDANNGTSSGAPWLTPNHAALVCGDVIIAAAGAYRTSGLAITTSPGTCPSTTGGIDGAGGIYAAALVCETAFACTMAYAGSGGTGGFDVAANYWAIEGWQLTTSGGNAGCYSADGSASGSTIHHHIMFINDICNDSGIGFFTQDNGINHLVPGNGIDYFAVVDSLTWKANQRADFPTASIVAVGITNIDATSGTHIFFSGNVAIANAVLSSSTAYSDLEGMMIDSPDVHGFTGQIVIDNNIIYGSSSWGMQLFEQSFNSSTLNIETTRNTIYGNMTCTPFAEFASGEINLQLSGGFPYTINTYKNIALTNRLTVGCNGSGGDAYAMLSGGALGTSTINTGGSGKENIFKGLQSACQGTCDTGKNVVVFNSFPLGTNTYTDPLFNDTTDLLANHLTQPNCSGYSDVAACMGWVNGSQTATAGTVIYDLTATAGAASGKGYQPPGACAADALYPTMLKGLVYLSVSGATITEQDGGVQKPCGM